MNGADKNMTFGLFMLNSVPPWKTDAEEVRDELEQIKVADELGFHSAWVAEHNANIYGVVSSAHLFLMAAAAQTKQIKLGTAALRLPLYHHPLKLAEDLALVDIISNGRLYVGVGKGYDEREFSAYSVDFSQRDEMYQETLDVLELALKNEKITYNGKYFNIQDVPTYPQPVQTSGPPIFVMVTNSDASIVRAAEQGYSFILGNYSQVTYEDAKRKIDLYRKTALAAGFSEEDVDKALARSGKQAYIYVAESVEQAIEEYRQGYGWFMEARNSRGIAGYSSESVQTYDYDYFVTKKNAIIGSPDMVIEEIEQFRQKTGLNHMVCYFNVGGQPQQQVLRSMRLFADKVMPQFSGNMSLSN